MGSTVARFDLGAKEKMALASETGGLDRWFRKLKWGEEREEEGGFVKMER